MQPRPIGIARRNCPCAFFHRWGVRHSLVPGSPERLALRGLMTMAPLVDGGPAARADAARASAAGVRERGRGAPGRERVGEAAVPRGAQAA